MHDYKEEDLVTCLSERRLVFVGDSATRQVFRATAKKLGFQEKVENYHADFVIRRKGVTVEFIWDPYLNSSSLRKEFMAASLLAEEDQIADTTAMLLIGGGLWHARYLDGVYMPNFKSFVQALSQTTGIQDMEFSEKPGPRSADNVLSPHSIVILAPVPVPVYKSLTPTRAKTMTPERINPMNLHLQQVSMERVLHIARSYTYMTAKEERAYQSDGLHVTEDVANKMADVLLNLRCNAVLRRAQAKPYPMDKTCCNTYEPPNWTQKVILNVSMGLVPISVVASSLDSKRLSFLPSRRIMRSVMVLASALCYCYYADRTQMFNKVQKQFETADFMMLCSIIFSLGILSSRRSAATVHSKAESTVLSTRDENFLSRRQTDEWKGWMQSIILVYHYTGASKVLWIYKIIRLLVASYLFLSGFGHTVFFYKKADYSLHRCALVLIRLNMLSCVLPYMMNTDYLFYYFAPLVSFWYLVIFFTMAVGHSRNHSLTFLMGKIAISATLMTVMNRYSKVFELLFYILGKLCNIRWDVKEWRFRLQLDCYIVYVGMLCAITFLRISDALHSNGLGNTSFDKWVWRFFDHARLASGIFAILALPTFFILASRTASKQEYNSWVPYVSSFPILSFIILRNFSRQTRNFHSPVFAWMGRHSLETFTLQYHIWLAADTRGLLALGLVERATAYVKDGRRLDLAVLTIIFLWVCWHVAEATQTLTSWLIDPGEGRKATGADEDIGAEEEGISSIQSIVIMKSNTSMGRLLRKVGAGAIRLAKRIKKTVAGDLRARLAIILGIMWLLNMVSACCKGTALGNGLHLRQTHA